MNGPAAARHDLLRLTSAGWSGLLARRPDLAALPGIRLWAEQGHPAMIRRRLPGDDPALLPAAIALPLAHGRARLGFQVATGEVASLRAPPSLREALGGIVAGAWRERAIQVLAEADRLDFRPRIFGSLMWQGVTGLAYLREGSDLDLVWPVAPGYGQATRLPSLIAALGRLGLEPGPGIDGEIMLDGVGAVHWRELADGGAHEILVKTQDEVRLMARDRFLALASAPC